MSMQEHVLHAKKEGVKVTKYRVPICPHLLRVCGCRDVEVQVAIPQMAVANHLSIN